MKLHIELDLPGLTPRDFNCALADVIGPATLIEILQGMLDGEIEPASLRVRKVPDEKVNG